MNNPRDIQRHYNEFGEELEIVGDIVMNLHYWDCACPTADYIHPVSLERCWRCGKTQEEWPSSREPEVRALRERTNY